MKQVRQKVSLIKSFICRNQKGKKFIKESYETYLDEIRRLGKENLM